MRTLLDCYDRGVPRRAWTSTGAGLGPLVLAWLALALALVSSCSLAEPAPRTVAVGAVPNIITTTTALDPQAEALARAIAKSGSVELPVYFVRNGQLGVAVRPLPADLNVVRRAVDALVAGPTLAEAKAGLTTAVPSLTRVRAMRLDAGNVAVVDLTGSFSALGPANSAALRLAQIVYTVTTFPVTVRFYIDGRPAQAIGGYVLPARPLSRDDFSALAPPILLESVGPGQLVAPGKDVSGTTTSAGAPLGIKLTDAGGHVLFQGQAESAIDGGVRHSFRAAVLYKPVKSGPGMLTISELAPAPGTKPLVVAVPVMLR